jgi:hypothetical protein
VFLRGSETFTLLLSLGMGGRGRGWGRGEGEGEGGREGVGLDCRLAPTHAMTNNINNFTYCMVSPLFIE